MQWTKNSSSIVQSSLIMKNILYKKEETVTKFLSLFLTLDPPIKRPHMTSQRITTQTNSNQQDLKSKLYKIFLLSTDISVICRKLYIVKIKIPSKKKIKSKKMNRETMKKGKRQTTNDAPY